MNKRIMLLALGAVSALMLAVPAMASAIQALHVFPTPVGPNVIHDIGANPKLSAHDGTFVECDSVSGSATFETGGTTGTLALTFGPNCKTNVGGECTNTGVAGNNHITVSNSTFHLATVVHREANPHTAQGSPGILVTPGGGELFTKFTCHKIGGFLTVDKEVTGTGVVGTITTPKCGEASNHAIIKFEQAANGTQTHDTLKNTTTTYVLNSNGSAAQNAEVTVTLPNNTTLECT